MTRSMGLVAAALAVASGATIALAQGGGTLAERGRQVFADQGCYGCHMIGRFGTPIGPDLSRVGAKYDAGYLRKWLEDPSRQRPSAHMPKLELTPEEIAAVAAFLAQQR